MPLLVENKLHEGRGHLPYPYLSVARAHSHKVDSTPVCALEELRVQALKQAEHHTKAHRAPEGYQKALKERGEGWGDVTFLLKTDNYFKSKT